MCFLIGIYVDLSHLCRFATYGTAHSFLSVLLAKICSQINRRMLQQRWWLRELFT